MFWQIQKPPDDQIWTKVSTSLLSARCSSSPALHSQCFWSRWLEPDYNQHLVSTFLCLSGRFYWKSHLLPLVWSHASSKWEMAHFPLHFPFTIHGECLAVFKPSADQKAQHRINPQPKETQLLQHWHHCRESKFWLFAVSVAETLLPSPERNTHNDHLDAW